MQLLLCMHTISGIIHSRNLGQTLILSKERAKDIALRSYEYFLHFSPVAYNQITHMFAQRKKKLAEVLKRD